MIGTSVTSIGAYAFEGCVGLTTVTFGTGVTSIGRFVFSSCVSLQTIYYYKITPLTLEAYALGGFDKSQCTLYVPIGAKKTIRQQMNGKTLAVSSNQISPQPISPKQTWSRSIQQAKQSLWKEYKAEKKYPSIRKQALSYTQ